MGFLAGKRILITGLLSNRSIAYGIARAMHREGAELAFTFQNERFQERVAKLASEFGSTLVFPCDVQNDDEITGLFELLGAHWDGLDGLVHSLAYAPGEALEGDFLDGLSREAFRTAQEVSAYSFPALAKAARPMMKGRNGVLITMTYLGAVRTMPNYNVMGLAKASLEASVRYMTVSLGPEGTRVNAISAGPIKTLAASGIGSFGKLFSEAIEAADRKPVEGITSTGGSHILGIRFGILPEVFPVLMSQILYYFESNTRSASIIGIVGAGGIGLHLAEAIRTLELQQTSFIVLMILVAVAAIDFLSGKLRFAMIGRRGGTAV